jgi:glycosyltransferase involved in cell wall biosynthesis
VLGDSHPDLATIDQSPVAVYTGRLHESKGLRDLVRAWPIVMLRWPQARLWLIGDGPDREELFELILDLGLRDAVFMPGAFDDVQDVLAAADVFVLPSYEEGMSLSLLEAMARGVPVVASDIPGNRLLVDHQDHGLLAPLRDPVRLAQTIHEVFAAPRAAQRRAQLAHDRVRERYSLRHMAETHLALFETLIGRKQSGGRRGRG